MARALFDELRADGSDAERQALANRLARALMQMLIARFAGDEDTATGTDTTCSIWQWDGEPDR